MVKTILMPPCGQILAPNVKQLIEQLERYFLALDGSLIADSLTMTFSWQTKHKFNDYMYIFGNNFGCKWIDLHIYSWHFFRCKTAQKKYAGFCFHRYSGVFFPMPYPACGISEEDNGNAVRALLCRLQLFSELSDNPDPLLKKSFFNHTRSIVFEDKFLKSNEPQRSKWLQLMYKVNIVAMLISFLFYLAGGCLW